MIVKLQRRTFLDDPDWILVFDEVPLGTEYEVIGFDRLTILNLDTKKHRVVECYLVIGHGDIGYLPVDLFKTDEHTIPYSSEVREGVDNSSLRKPTN